MKLYQFIIQTVNSKKYSSTDRESLEMAAEIAKINLCIPPNFDLNKHLAQGLDYPVWASPPARRISSRRFISCLKLSEKYVVMPDLGGDWIMYPELSTWYLFSDWGIENMPPGYKILPWHGEDNVYLNYGWLIPSDAI
jgi:hypothetical protein